MAVTAEYQIYWVKLDEIEAEEWNLIYNFIAKFNLICLYELGSWNGGLDNQNCFETTGQVLAFPSIGMHEFKRGTTTLF
jgi:hypothetical protein